MATLEDRGRIEFARFFHETSPFVAEEIELGNEVGLGTLIAPLTTAEFLRNHLFSRAVRIPRAGAAKLSFFTLERFRALLSQQFTAGFALDANFRSSSKNSLFEVERAQVGHLLDAGATICATSIELIDPRLHALALRMKREIRFSGQIGVNCYLSPDGAGFTRHFDTKAVLIVQIEGKKKWKYCDEPAVPFPRRAARVARGAVELHKQGTVPIEDWELPAIAAQEEHEVVLSPGDVLCLPPGTWHEAQAIGYSLALTIACQPIPSFALFAQVLARRLDAVPHWRGGPPPTEDAQACPTVVRSHFAQSVNDLRQVISELDENDPALWQLWSAAVNTQRRGNG